MKIHQRENHQKIIGKDMMTKENEIQKEEIQIMSISDSDSQIINIANNENQSKNKKMRKNIKCDKCSYFPLQRGSLRNHIVNIHIKNKP